MSKDDDLQSLIFGSNGETGLVAVEHLPGKTQDEMVLFFRRGHATERSSEPFAPFLWTENAALLTGYAGKTEIVELAGDNPLKYLVRFPSWKEFQKATSWLRKTIGYNPTDPAAPYFLINDPVQQHLLATGRTLFKGMQFDDLRRMQIDLETFCDATYEFSNPERESDRIVAIAMADQTGWTDVLSGAAMDEKAMLETLVQRVAERDPDVLEGHNFFNFDLPYIAARAKRHKVKLALGRDGSAPESRPGRLNTADRTIPYSKFEIFGRQIIDTYFLAQIYDVSARALESFGLKDIAVQLGVAAPDRTYIEGSEIARTFLKDPETVMKYARDDIVETRAVSRLLSPSYFVQAQILPFSYQNVCVRGNAAKIDSLLLREYLRRSHSIPRPDTPREFEGGYTDIFFTGVAKNVHHCDVRSLYPSLILNHKLTPRTDRLEVFLHLLSYLRDLRLDTRKRMAASQSPEERTNLDAMQTTFKILINSFYGYLGFSQARFSDFDMAEKITAEGRALLRQMIQWTEQHGGKPIEIDTDGIYFVPPEFRRKNEQETFRAEFRQSLPAGIEVEFDGEYRAMFSYKMKNYALLGEDGEITIKGAALKSRGLEPFQRQFMNEWLRMKLAERDGEIPALVEKYRKAIEGRNWPIQMLAKTETLQDSPDTYAAKIQKGGRGRNAAYELALKSGREYKAGDQISYYVTGNTKSVAVHAGAKFVSEWQPDRRDENVPYYLAKLDALSRKFDAMAAPEFRNELGLDFGGEPEGEA